MKKIIIRQNTNRGSHFPSEKYVDTIIAKNIDIPYKIKQKGSNTLSISFDSHLDDEKCKLLAKKIGLEIEEISPVRAYFSFPY